MEGQLRVHPQRRRGVGLGGAAGRGLRGRVVCRPGVTPCSMVRCPLLAPSVTGYLATPV